MSDFFHFLSGMLMMGFSVAALFFFRFWVKTRDRIFAYFGSAFFILAFERWILTIISGNNTAEDHPQVYFLRLFAFLTILYGINAKNRSKSLP
jgi:hypothetical protein